MKTIAIVGRPNVGKSRLFNRIIRRRYSIVDDAPGITRDRVEFVTEDKSGQLRWIDTGGIGLVDDFAEAVAFQARVAIEAAHAIIFVVDAQTGILPLDRQVAEELRNARHRKPVVVAMNKADHARLESHWPEFAKLGLGDVVPVSAEHGLGIEALVDKAVALCGDDQELEESATVTKVAIVGKPNVGKSSLLNAILGRERVIVSSISGTTRDAIEDSVDTPDGKIILIDTAGIRKKRTNATLVENVMVGRARKAVENADVAVIVVDAVDGFADQDVKILSAVLAMGKGAVIALNKWDAVTEKEFDKRVAVMKRKLRTESHVPIISISALEHLRIPRLLETVLKVSRNTETRIKTGDFNRILSEVSQRAPQGIAIKYGIQKSIHPPTFLVFTGKKPPPTLIGYIRNSIRALGGFEGVPIVVEAR